MRLWLRRTLVLFIFIEQNIKPSTNCKISIQIFNKFSDCFKHFTMKKNETLLKINFRRILIHCCLMIAVLFFNTISKAQQKNQFDGMMEVGVARVDITPETPIRLTGYASREKSETQTVIHRLNAKALAFGTLKPAVFITVDLIGIPGNITAKLAEKLSAKMGLDPAQLVIAASHTHGGPEVGNLLNILQYRGSNFSDSLLSLNELAHIAQYTEQLSGRLEELALAALKDRKPALVAWGQGQVGFAQNRRSQDGPVDPALPILRITNPDGSLKAVLVNYACHGTTLEGDVNEIHGDWISEAQKLIEARSSRRYGNGFYRLCR